MRQSPTHISSRGPTFAPHLSFRTPSVSPVPFRDGAALPSRVSAAPERGPEAALTPELPQGTSAGDHFRPLSRALIWL